MKRTLCSVCRSERRAEVDEALVRGEGLRTIAERTGLGRMSIHRHKPHVERTLLRAHEIAEVARADDLLSQLRALQDRALGLLSRAERRGDIRAAAASIREARGCLELLGRLAGELQDGATVNLVLAPEWVALRGRILIALQPYAEARQAVVKALEAGDVGA